MVYRTLRGVVAPVVVIVLVLALVPAAPAAAAAGQGPGATAYYRSADDLPAFRHSMGAEFHSDGELTAESSAGPGIDTDLGPIIDPNG